MMAAMEAEATVKATAQAAARATARATTRAYRWSLPPGELVGYDG